MSTAPGSVREWLAMNCVRVAGNPEFRVYDQKESLDLVPVFKTLADVQHPAPPCWIISTPSGNTAAVLPATKDEALAALKAAIATPVKGN